MLPDPSWRRLCRGGRGGVAGRVLRSGSIAPARRRTGRAPGWRRPGRNRRQPASDAARTAIVSRYAVVRGCGFARERWWSSASRTARHHPHDHVRSDASTPTSGCRGDVVAVGSAHWSPRRRAGRLVPGTVVENRRQRAAHRWHRRRRTRVQGGHTPRSAGARPAARDDLRRRNHYQRAADVLRCRCKSVVLRRDAQGVERSGVFVVADGQARFTAVESGAIGGLESQVSGVDERARIVVGPYQVLRELSDGAVVRVSAPGGRE